MNHENTLYAKNNIVELFDPLMAVEGEKISQHCNL